MSAEKTIRKLKSEVLRLRLENAHLKNEVRRSYHEIHGLRAQLDFNRFMKEVESDDERR